MRFERHHSTLIVASVITVASFVGATAYTQNRLARLDALSSTIENNSVPSVDYLSRAAVRLTRLNQLLDDAEAGGPQRAPALAAARAELQAVEDDIAPYLRLPPLSGEAAYWTSLQTDVNTAVHLVHQEIDAGSANRRSLADHGADHEAVDDALDRAVRSVLAALAYDIRQSEDIARQVRGVRSTTLSMIVELDAGATLLALFAAVVAYRASRRHDDLLRQHSALLADRVDELDRFAGRVAHDVLSPLGAIAAGLSLLGRSSDERGRTYIERSQRALQRVQRLVEDLLMFARSGARPEPGSRCAVDTVVGNVVADAAESAAENGIELLVDTDRSIEVPCSPGVVASIVQNLVRNAIKYMGSRALRRIVIRTARTGATMTLEVEDTGPGIPHELQATLFEPFVRGPHETVKGTGLGLATVKRLVDSHGGSVVVRSRPGGGTVFTIALPAIAPAVEHTTVGAHHV